VGHSLEPRTDDSDRGLNKGTETKSGHLEAALTSLRQLRRHGQDRHHVLMETKRERAAFGALKQQQAY
jgi:hypothetical protein